MKRDRTLTELMDDPDCDPVKLLRTYRQFGFVNKMFSNWCRIYKRTIQPHLKDGTRKYTLLDVGCGLMDNSRYIQKLAEKDGYSIEITGIDPNPVVNEYFNSRKMDPDTRFIPCYLHEVPPDKKFDFVISNHLLHHLEDHQIRVLHQEIADRTNTVAMMNDIERSMWAYIGFSVISLPYKGWTFIHTDGRRSIRRSLETGELSALVPEDWRVHRFFPFRLVSVYETS